MGRFRRRMGQGTTKTQACKIHAKNRSFQRYPIVLTNDDLRLLVRKIQDGKGEYLEKKSNRVTRWLVEHREIMWDLVYDKDRHTVITCLPFKQ